MAENIGPEARGFYDRERALDWLTALFPLWLIAVVYYRWTAVLPVLPAMAGCVAASLLLCRTERPAAYLLPALVTGGLIVFCLPAGVPLWAPALAGCVAGLTAALSELLSRRFAQKSFARPLLQPALVGVVLLWLLFPDRLDTFTMPAQWVSADGVTAATSLAGLVNENQAVPLMRLFFGVYPGAVGQTCSPVVLMAGVYLGLRRRLRLIAPACMLGTVALLSWIVWGQPLYSLLSGGTLLAALLLADRTVAPTPYGLQAVTGCLAALIGVLVRQYTHTDGMAAGVLAACGLAPLLALMGRWLARFCHWISPKLRPLWEKIRNVFKNLKFFKKKS